MESVGIRELKAQLSRHLKRVQGGASLAVTERGRTIATIHPIAADQRQPDVEWARALVADGKATWSGGKPAGARPGVRQLPGAPSLSDAVLEDRR